MDWSVVSSLSEALPVATKKDLLVYVEGPNNYKRGVQVDSPVMAIRRRTNEGVYEHVANFTEFTSPFANTNGKWVALLGEGAVLFSVDENNQVSNMSYVDTMGGYLLADDTFVGYDPNSPLNDGNYTIRTYQYEASNNTWLNIPGTEVNVRDAWWQADISSYRASDTHLVLIDTSSSDNVTVNIYARQADRSWSLVETVPVNNTVGSQASVTYNGVDTVVLSILEEEESAIGIIFTYTKINGKWIEQKFTPASVGYRPVALLGFAVVFADANTLLISAGFEGLAEMMTLQAGKVLVLTRTNSGAWEPMLDFVANQGFFGLGIGANDHDIIIAAVNPVSSLLQFYAAPRCFTQPISATCADEQVSDCSQVDISALYTVNNPQCGAVDTTLTGIGLVNNKVLQAQFSFNKGFGPVAYCNATVTCPQIPTGNVSGANVVQFSLVLLFVMLFVFV